MNVTDLGLFDLDYMINKMYNKFSFLKKIYLHLEVEDGSLQAVKHL